MHNRSQAMPNWPRHPDGHAMSGACDGSVAMRPEGMSVVAKLAILWMVACLGTAASIDAHAGADAPDDAEQLYLQVILNGKATTVVAPFQLRDGHLYCQADVLAALGLKNEGAAGASAEVALDGMDGVSYRYDAAAQQLVLQVPERWLRPYVATDQLPSVADQARSGHGLLVNYDVYAQEAGGLQLSAWTELRYFAPSGVWDSTGTYYHSAFGRRFVRYDTSWVRSDEASLHTLQVGDTISNALDWTRSVRLAGIQWRKDFSLRPDLITFPLPALGGSAAVPSSVDLYINNVRRSTFDVPAGPFTLNTAPGLTGAGEAVMVTRDAQGRSITTSLPLYIDVRLLAEGMSAYSVEAGFLRRRYGERSFDYERQPSFSGAYRYGMSDALTLETHAEATAGLAMAGGGALARLGQYGVLHGSLAISAGRTPVGYQWSLGYQWIQPRLALDMVLVRGSTHFADLATRSDAPLTRSQQRLTLAVPIRDGENLALSYLALRTRGLPDSRIASLSYLRASSARFSWGVNVFRDLTRTGSSGVYLTGNLSLGDNRTASMLAGRQNGSTYVNAQASRPADYAGGWGWSVQAGRTGPIAYRQAQATYLGSLGQITGLLQTTAGQTTYAMDALGSLVWMDGDLHASRHIDNGFALVSTDGMPGVPVLHENRLIGSTDAHGHLLVPDLNPYQANRISVDTLNMPADVRAEAVDMQVVPAMRSGVLARFAFARQAAATLRLTDTAGRPLPVGSKVHAMESGVETIVGYDGIAYLEGLQATNRLQVTFPGGMKTCMVTFDYATPADHVPPRLGPFACTAVAP